MTQPPFLSIYSMQLVLENVPVLEEIIMITFIMVKFLPLFIKILTFVHQFIEGKQIREGANPSF